MEVVVGSRHIHRRVNRLDVTTGAVSTLAGNSRFIGGIGMTRHTTYHIRCMQRIKVRRSARCTCVMAIYAVRTIFRHECREYGSMFGNILLIRVNTINGYPVMAAIAILLTQFNLVPDR